MISKGEIRPNTPVIFGIQENEGELFANVAFIANKTPRRWIAAAKLVYGDTADEVLSIYPPPCMDNRDPDCSCQAVSADWLTDYSWIGSQL